MSSGQDIVNVGGRPTKYKPEYDEMLIEHMSSGLSFESFAGVISVNQDTLHEWAKVNPSFSEAKKIAFSKCRCWWEKAGISGLWGSKDSTFNAAVWIFNMKNRFKWTDKVEVESSQTNTITLAYRKHE